MKNAKQQAIVFPEAIFLVVPKVANTSIKVALLKWKKIPYKTGPNGPLVHGSLFNYAPVQKIDKYKQTKIGFVRDPWSRLVSCYRNKVEDRFYSPLKGLGLTPKSSFEDFLNAIEKHWGTFNNHWAPCYLWAEHADIIARFESIVDDWNEIRKLYGMPTIPHENQTGTKKVWKRYYTPKLMKKVRKMYQKDVDTWYSNWEYGL